VKPAVVIVDMLDDFVTGSLANPRAERIIPNIAELAARARELGWPVIYANDAHLPGDFEERVWGPHALAGSPGARVIERLAPQAGDLELPSGCTRPSTRPASTPTCASTAWTR
jgi:nicotinamidase-related amidase